METYHDKVLDSPSKNSYIGSYYQPPDRVRPISRPLELPAHSSAGPRAAGHWVSHTKPAIDSKAVVEALKTLQEKIRQLELERKQAEKSYQQFFHDAQAHRQVTASYSQTAASRPETNNSTRKAELDFKLQAAEARCNVLEKQLNYMRKMVENAKKDRNALKENQVSLQNKQSSSNNQTQREKLENLESECLKLSRTQTVAEMKLAILEQRLLKEEHERKLVQEKANELQRELDVNLQLSVSTAEETKPKKKTKKNMKKTSKQSELPLGSPKHQKMPFVAGTSTSPSHSVHANVQSILHMMKHHQPQLCEQVSALHRFGCAAKKSLQKEFCQKPDCLPVDQSLSSLSDLLLALQDELGQMSFAHQELLHQIDATHNQEQRQDLERELEWLVGRMEEKGAQITKLRKHQRTVHKLTQSHSCAEEHTAAKRGIKPPVPSPVKDKQKGKKGPTMQNNLQLLRETRKFRSSLKQDDLSWET
ncbi:centrosomal protein CEP57L1 isoform X1 [Brachyistius frenatus]|uniref:centrosomal protein CEP57L1 isoform X1 n=1 Tax=Brachyistius frenatus TaxID=100188 RepID=UPI0037E84DC1